MYVSVIIDTNTATIGILVRFDRKAVSDTI